MKSLVAALLVTFSSGQWGLAQNRVVQVPFDIQSAIRDIRITITVLELYRDNGWVMKARFSIPVNGTILQFEAEDIPFYDGNPPNFGPFLLKPLSILSPDQEDYLQRLMRPHGGYYKWDCQCACDSNSISF
jgi:hypothetical protein